MAAYNHVYNIIKSCEDNREYKGYELQNKMKVLLVSDPTTEKAAAAVDIHIGKIFLQQSYFPKDNDHDSAIAFILFWSMRI